MVNNVVKIAIIISILILVQFLISKNYVCYVEHEWLGTMYGCELQNKAGMLAVVFVWIFGQISKIKTKRNRILVYCTIFFAWLLLYEIIPFSSV